MDTLGANLHAGETSEPWRRQKQPHEAGPPRMVQAEIDQLSEENDLPGSGCCGLWGWCWGRTGEPKRNRRSTREAPDLAANRAPAQGPECYRWQAWCGCSGMVATEAAEYTWREVRAAPLMTCLGACTVFLVVLVAAVLQTLLARAPLIFLRLAENAEGYYDAILTPSMPGVQSLNYTLLDDRLRGASTGGRLSYSSPRILGEALVVGDAGCPLAGELAAAEPLGVGLYRRLDNQSMYVVRGTFDGAAAVDGEAATADSAPLNPGLGPANPFGADTRGAASPEAALRALCGTSTATTFPVNRGGAGAKSQELTLVDEEKEERMGLGRGWRDTGRGAIADELPDGAIALHDDVASSLGVSPGDYVTVATRLGRLSREALAPPDPCPESLPPYRGGNGAGVARGLAAADNDVVAALRYSNGTESTGGRCDGWSLSDQRFGVVVGRMLLARTFGAGAGGKVANSAATGAAFMSLQGTARWLVQEGLHPAVRWAGAEGASDEPESAASGGGNPQEVCGGVVPAIACASIVGQDGDTTSVALPRAAGPDVAALRSEWYAGSIHVAMPPTDRINAYASANFDQVQAIIGEFTSDALYAAGFTQLSSSLGVLDALREGQFVTLYLGLVLDVLLAVLFALATVLIYSLLLINTSGRRFEVGVRRMLGQTRPAIVGLLGMQAATYAIPAWAIGLIVAQLLAAAVLGSFADLAGLGAGGSALQRLSPEAIVTATVLAVAIPAIAAIVPIRQALTEDSLREAADASRPSGAQKVVEVTVERSAGSGPPIAALIAGIVAVGFGFGIYYVLPLSLLSLNLRLFFNLFLAVLLGLMAGLVALAMNLEAIVEQVVSVILLQWWEAEVVVNLALANLAAHRTRNQKTLAMYALSIAFIVFVFVAASQEVQTAEFTARQALGSPVVLEAPSSPQSAEALLVAESALSAASAGSGAAWAAAADLALESQPDPSQPLVEHRSWAETVVSSLDYAIAADAGDVGADMPPQADASFVEAWSKVHGLSSSVRWVSRSGLGNSARGLGDDGWRQVSARFESRTIQRTVSADSSTGDEAEGGDGGATGSGGDSGALSGLTGGGSSELSTNQEVLLPGVLLRTMSRLGTAAVRPFAVSPGVESALDEAYLRYASATRRDWQQGEDRVDGLGLTRGLYGARGGQRAVMSASLRLQLPGWRRGDRALVTTTEAVPSTAGGGARSSRNAWSSSQEPWSQEAYDSTASSYDYLSRSRAAAIFAARSLALGPSSRAPDGYNYGSDVFGDSSSGGFIGESAAATDAGGDDLYSENTTEVVSPVSASLWATTLRSASLLRSSALFDFSRTGEEETSVLMSIPALLEVAAYRGRHVPAAGLPLWRGLWQVPGGDSPDSYAGRAAASDAEAATEAAARLATAVTASYRAGYGSLPEGPYRVWASEGEGASGAEDEEARSALAEAYFADAVSGIAAVSSDATAPLAGSSREGLWEANSVSSDLGDLSSVLAAINFLFAVLAVVVMFLCFFSLLASVATNIREQQREIGVLRAVGLSPSRLARVYAHEASLLVAAAALLGTGVGTASAWAFAQQRSLFTGLPLALVFPWSIVIAVVLVSFLCGLLASCAPARTAGQERITKLTAGGT